MRARRCAGTRCWVAALVVLAAACGDNPTGPLPAQTGATSAFDVAVRYPGSPSTAVRNAVQTAVVTWSAAIVGDLRALRLNAAANECFDGQPALDEAIDDLLLFVLVTHIDGAGKALAESGPCYTRSQGSLPAMGVVRIDADDIPTIEAQGLLRDLVAHEIGHVLGFGTIWSGLDLLTGAGGSDPRFLGAAALQAYQVLGGSPPGVPVENAGDAGTRDSHWRESTFGRELMTGYINVGSNPLSALTIASLRDLGYVTDPTAAGSYSLPRPSGRAADVLPGDSAHWPVHEVLLTPRRRIAE